MTERHSEVQEGGSSHAGISYNVACVISLYRWNPKIITTSNSQEMQMAHRQGKKYTTSTKNFQESSRKSDSSFHLQNQKKNVVGLCCSSLAKTWGSGYFHELLVGVQ